MSQPDAHAAERFKLDENLPIELAAELRDSGYDCATVLQQDLGGGADSEIAAVCAAEGRVLVTCDRGFGDIRSYAPGSHAASLSFPAHLVIARSWRFVANFGYSQLGKG